MSQYKNQVQCPSIRTKFNVPTVKSRSSLNRKIKVKSIPTVHSCNKAVLAHSNLLREILS